MDKFEITLDKRGLEIGKYCTQYSCTNDFMVASDGFTFEVYHSDLKYLRQYVKPWAQISFTVNGCPQFVGQIDTVTFENDGTLSVSCSDYLSNAADCSIGKNIQILKGETVESAIKQIGQSQSFTTVTNGWNDVRNRMAGTELFTDSPATDYKSIKLNETLKSQPDDGIWETISNLAKVNHCTVNAGFDRSTVILCAPEYRQRPAYKAVRLIGNAATNVEQATTTLDYSGCPTVLVATGKQGASSEKAKGTYVEQSAFDGAFGESQGIQDIIKGDGVAAIFDGRFQYKPGTSPGDVIYREMRVEFNGRTKSGRKSKKLKAETHAELESLCARTLAEARKNTLTWKAVFPGHSINDVIIVPDTLISVTDEIGGVYEDLWIRSRTISFDGRAQRTSVITHRPGSFVL